MLLSLWRPEDKEPVVEVGEEHSGHGVKGEERQGQELLLPMGSE